MTNHSVDAVRWQKPLPAVRIRHVLPAIERQEKEDDRGT